MHAGLEIPPESGTLQVDFPRRRGRRIAGGILMGILVPLGVAFFAATVGDPLVGGLSGVGAATALLGLVIGGAMVLSPARPRVRWSAAR